MMADVEPRAVADATLAAWLLAVDPSGLGGIVLRSRAGPVRERWIAGLRAALAPDRSLRRVPLHADESRLFGGLDLAATLAAGRPVVERGLLREAAGDVLLLSMAERIQAPLAARLTASLDACRPGSDAVEPASRVGLVALDEGIGPDERPPPALLEHLAFWIDLDALDPGQAPEPPLELAEARRSYPTIEAAPGVIDALVATASALGVGSLRAPLFALRAARAISALRGGRSVEDADAATAARLVLAPRATRLPVADQVRDPAHEDAPVPPPDAASPPPGSESQHPPPDPATHQEDLAELVLSATQAAIPPGLLERLQAAAASISRGQTAGGAGSLQNSLKRGRPAGVRRGRPGQGVRLNVIETLRAAAPWQRLRGVSPGLRQGGQRLEIRRDDLRITRLKQRRETMTLFVVDASGSLAANRLAEAKGAVELLLAECYVRRDQVALLAFRGRTVDLLLPPTRSLPRAKRCLAELPGGGSTPLALAIDAAVAIVEQVRRRGQTPLVVFLTDGRANVARDGTLGRAKAEDDARDAARLAAQCGARMLVVDAGARPQPPAKALAEVLQALYVPLPRAEAGALSRAVQTMATV